MKSKSAVKEISFTEAAFPQTVHLEYRVPPSDKVYTLALQQCETGWSVYAQWGRRGSVPQADYKCERETFELAKGIYDRVLHEKLAKGYKYSGGTKSEQGDPEEGRAAVSRKPAASAGEGVSSRPVSRVIVFAPELLTRISERELLGYVRSPRHWFQWKRDGVRLTVCTEDGGAHVHGYNKLGQVVQVDARLAKAILTICNKFGVRTLMIDGEWEASGFWGWDVLQVNDMDMRNIQYKDRFETLEEYFTDLNGDPSKVLHLTQTAKTTEDKGAMIEITKKLRVEGICVKQITATHRVGRAGQHLKHKYEATGSFIVGPKPKHKANDGHRSVALYVIDKGKQRFVATVKIPDCYDVPANGSVIEVRYLYAYRDGGIVQPCVSWEGHSLTMRTDVTASECTAQQLKYKAESEAA